MKMISTIKLINRVILKSPTSRIVKENITKSLSNTKTPMMPMMTEALTKKNKTNNKKSNTITEEIQALNIKTIPKNLIEIEGM